MAKQTIILFCMSVALCLGAPAEEAVQVPDTTHVQGQVNVKPPLLSVPIAQVTVKDKEHVQDDQQKQQDVQQEIQNAVIPDNIQVVQQEPIIPPVPVLPEVEGGPPSPDLLEDGDPSEGDKTDLDTANSWGWGWRGRGWGGGWGRGYGGGWGRGYGGWGGYHRPYYGGYYRGHGWGHGWGRGWGYGWG